MSPLQGKRLLLLLLVSFALLSLALGQATNGQAARAGRSYSDISRVVNPNPHAFVGLSSLPGQNVRLGR
ncbi:hypothetical protein KR093_002820 [Drosophila rubida]|uniref:Uncharacterized protein n=1 Tax=Drosophila rubida TaxID=30044 RepID=A0AAD4K9L5_9MUSC|nr:hypothetical protein KR093_002820 [Drosophila rubida]